VKNSKKTKNGMKNPSYAHDDGNSQVDCISMFEK